MARPVLVSDEAATGIDASDGENWYICRDDEAFRERVLELAGQPDRAKEMGRAARSFVIEEMSWAAVEAGLARIVGRSDVSCHHAA